LKDETFLKVNCKIKYINIDDELKLKEMSMYEILADFKKEIFPKGLNI